MHKHCGMELNIHMPFCIHVCYKLAFKAMAPHSSTLAWKIPWTEEPGRLQSMRRRSLVGCSPWGREESDTTKWLHFHFSFSCIGDGNGNPLQCSCLENPRDGGAWWAAVYGVTQSRTRLKWLSRSSSIHIPGLSNWRSGWYSFYLRSNLGVQVERGVSTIFSIIF